jgi:hypothetical protein
MYAPSQAGVALQHGPEGRSPRDRPPGEALRRPGGEGFGISMWTYYSWRSPARGIHVKTKAEARARANGSHRDLRSEVETQVRRVLPKIVKEEVNALLFELFGRRGPGRPRTRV